MSTMDQRLIHILANKPEMISDFPEWMMSASEADEIAASEGTAVAEIAGRDSIAAVIRACEVRDIRGIVPTVAYTGTEYGDWGVPFEKIQLIKKRLKTQKVKVYNTLIIGAPEFWWNLCGRLSSHFFTKYGFYSPCIGCHLYFHAIRIPVAKRLQCDIVIGGERESHDGKIKVNQTRDAIEAYKGLMTMFGLELFLPLRHIESGAEVEKMIGEQWDEGEQQLECVLSGNYRDAEGGVPHSLDAVKLFLSEFGLDRAAEFVRQHTEK